MEIFQEREVMWMPPVAVEIIFWLLSHPYIGFWGTTKPVK